MFASSFLCCFFNSFLFLVLLANLDGFDLLDFCLFGKSSYCCHCCCSAAPQVFVCVCMCVETGSRIPPPPSRARQKVCTRYGDHCLQRSYSHQQTNKRKLMKRIRIRLFLSRPLIVVVPNSGFQKQLELSTNRWILICG